MVQFHSSVRFGSSFNLFKRFGSDPLKSNQIESNHCRLLVVHMHHTTMVASGIHRSPIFCFCVIPTCTMLSVISRIVPFSPMYAILHVLSYFSTSSSRQFQQACPHLRVNELEAWHSNRNALPHIVVAS